MARVIYPIKRQDTISPGKEINAFADAVLTGLSADRKHIPAEYHYDDEGSRLFDQITELPEYYLTRAEIDALQRNAEEIVGHLGDAQINVIEFGPGDGRKTRALIRHLLERNVNFRYIAVDISNGALEQLSDDYESRFPNLPVKCLVATYSDSMKWLREHYRERNLVLFLGSSIGNFAPALAESFLLILQEELNEGDLALIGFDLAKDPELIKKAYNDPSGVTSEFNLNVLRRINRELDGDFEPLKFRYEGIYSESDRVVRSFLFSLENQHVRIGALDETFHFKRGERIHTEDSHKYRESDIERLASKSGFAVRTHLYDSRGFFIDSVWEVNRTG